MVDQFNGVSIIPDIQWARPDTVLMTDACLEEARGVNWECKEYFHFPFPPEITKQQHHINHLEVITLTVSLKLWAHLLTGRRLKVKCDNEVTVVVVNILAQGACLCGSQLPVSGQVCSYSWCGQQTSRYLVNVEQR